MERRFREAKKLSLKKRVLILCEGETEVKYFQGFKGDEQRRRRFVSVDVDIYQPQNYSPKGLVEEAKNKIKEARQAKNAYDSVWVLFDRDRHANIADAFVMAQAHNINIAFSNVCFELWILLHFERFLRPEDECDTMIAHVKRHIPEYQKASSHYFISKDKLETAIQNGKWVKEQTRLECERGAKLYELSAYTNVHELVEYLLSL